MKLFLLLTIIGIYLIRFNSALVVKRQTNTEFVRNPALDNNWGLFKCKFNKTYDSVEEELTRRGYWETNFDYIQTHNEDAKQGLHTYRLAENFMADMNHEERLGQKQTRIDPSTMNPGGPGISEDDMADLMRQSPPPSLDLRSNPCLVSVKYQKKCGACWAFAALTPIEYQVCSSTGVDVTLSEQQLMDCSSRFGNDGCQTGFYSRAWNYIYYTGGISSAKNYPYTGTVDTCKLNETLTKVKIQSWVYLPSNETVMKSALAKVGPVAVSIDATHPSFDFYSEGIYDEIKCYTDKAINHGGTVVGYGSLGGSNYWIFRNSWSERWGMKGYMLIRRGENTCSIASFPSYPIVGTP